MDVQTRRQYYSIRFLNFKIEFARPYMERLRLLTGTSLFPENGFLSSCKQSESGSAYSYTEEYRSLVIFQSGCDLIDPAAIYCVDIDRMKQYECSSRSSEDKSGEKRSDKQFPAKTVLGLDFLLYALDGFQSAVEPDKETGVVLYLRFIRSEEIL